MSRTTPPASHSELPQLREQLAGVCTRDYGRFLGRWRKLSRTRKPVAADVERLRRDIAASVAMREARVAAKPPLRLDAALPISERAEDIVGLIRDNPVVVVAGETGSGKTTQLPKLCLAAGRGEAGLIGCTQPRRLAARAVARRVAEEMDTSVGDKVGFQVRFTEKVSDKSLVKFMTDGILLAETQSDAWLSAYDTLIIDEAHERSLNIDFLLGYLKGLVKRRRDLKIIITSATIDTARFAAHFDDAPVVEVEGRTFPVDVRWRPVEDAAEERVQQGSPEHIVRAVDEIGAEDPRGDILVFLPGEREIRDAHKVLLRRQYRHTEILPLYARLSVKDQDRVFKPGPQRRIVLATNVAETSLTVPRIRCVIDTGTARVMRYSRRSQIERLHVEPVSQAAANQRKGRCGRIGPGICIRLYDEQDYDGRPRFTDPELLRSSLANVILRMLNLKLGDVEAFPFLDAPDPSAIADGYRRLAEVSAIDEEKRLTPMGRDLARLPIDVQLARMLIEARQQDVLADALVVVAFLSVQDPRQRPPEARQQADAAHRQFVDPKSDFVTVLNLWRAFAEARDELTQSRLRDWCTKHFLGYLRMREWREVHRQLLLVVKHDKGGSSSATRAGRRQRSLSSGRKAEARMDSGVRRNDGRDGDGKAEQRRYEALHLSLLAGLPTQGARKDEHGIYRGTRQRKFEVFPGSGLAKSPPNWVFAAQILDIGGKVWGMQCARIEPRWIERQAAHLIRHTCRDAHWSRKRGSVVAYEQVSLFGLVLVERRPVTFRRQDPALAHAIFVREALARCDIDCKAAAMRANQRVLAKARDIEARQRRQGLLKTDEELAHFFAGKLPEDISDSRALDAWYRKASPAEQQALQWSLDDVMASDNGLDAGAFPSTLELDGQRYRLTYRFIPGDAADGVTLHLPLSLLNALPAARCQWLVPGLVAEKVAEMIRGLPKSLRRNFVPAPDFARAFTEAESACDKPLAQVLAKFLTRTTGIVLPADAFDDTAFSAHLRVRFALVDDKGKLLDASRDLAELQAQWEGQARAAFSRKADVDLDTRESRQWDFADIPARIQTTGKPDAYPALVDQGTSVALRLFERNLDARSEHARGVERLLRFALESAFKRARKQLPISKTLALQYVPLGTQAGLREDLVEGGFADLLRERDLQVRGASAYETLHDDIARSLFGAAMERLKLAEPIIATQAEAQRWMRPARPGQSPASYTDLAEQLDHLIAPGFLRDLPGTRLAHYPRYLKAMRLRAERLQRDPGKDYRHLQQVLPYWRACLEHCFGERTQASEHLRWLLEEWRVSLFAQELKTAEPVSEKRMRNALDAVENPS
ncbi:MAG TPA: ATP-dependent RNA helicase HrpA [Oleiagrimonas sp.]|nr:ATP-dependent RNA helicase HrpA [Oleiagrimonas sp.]